tara:strand:+ start:350 stop:1249 length:900 start_codon:yes stop_codon:yes gene_type:complete
MSNFETVLFSNDSSYGGISFIANHIEDSCTILVHSVRKDFDSMINNKFYLNNNKKLYLDILSKSKRIIVFGVISLNSINLSNYKDKELILVITDSTFLKKNTNINNFLINNQNIKVLIMPDLIPFIDKKIKYKPYFQHINIDISQPIEKYEKLTFSHSPGLKYKSDLKGSKFIEDTLKNQKLIVIHNKNWLECIEIKKKTHIFIDQMVINNEYKYAGGIGKSGLESMLLKNILITSSPQLITEPFFENPSSISIKPNELKDTINNLIVNPDKMKEISQKQYEWAKKYTSLEFVKNNILH